MRPITYKSKVWVYVTLFTATILFISFSLLAIVYYWLSLNSFKKDLIFASKEIIANHLVFKDNQILFKKDSFDRTISANLRDENVSAVFLDSNLKAFATYGIYQKILTEDDLESKIDMPEIKASFDNNKPIFKEINFYPNEEYFILNTPVLYDGQKIGLLQVSIMTPFFAQVKSIGVFVLLAVICFSLLISWPLSGLLVRFLFKPLDSLVFSMEQARLNNLNFPLKYNGHPKDELSTLVETYNKMLSRLSDGFDRQKDFISHASHELKTPLSRAILSLDLALINFEDKKLDSIPNQVKEVRDDLFEFSNLIGDLLLLSRVDSGSIKLDMKPLKLIELIKELTVLYKKDVDDKSITFDVLCSNGLQINADLTCTRLILSNIVSNAIKYSRRNSKIEIKCLQTGSEVSIRVKDNGIGMSQLDLLKIFDRFFRSTEVSKIHGFGIGMSLVKQLCDVHRLRIDFNSILTRGTEVKVDGFKTAFHRE